jgi:hypothetical protein
MQILPCHSEPERAEYNQKSTSVLPQRLGERIIFLTPNSSRNGPRTRFLLSTMHQKKSVTRAVPYPGEDGRAIQRFRRLGNATRLLVERIN